MQQIKGKIVVTGSVTYEGLGEQPFHSAKQVVIISRHKKYPRNVKVVHTVLELITASCAAWGVSGTAMVYFVIVIYRTLCVGLGRQ